MLLMTVIGMGLLSVAHSLGSGLLAASLIGFSMGSEGDITPYLLSRCFGLKCLSTLYAFTWTMYAFGAAASPILIGKLFDSLGSHRPVTIQLLALPPFVSCLLIFLQPRDVEPYRILRLARRSSNREHLIRVLGPISEKSLARSSFHLAV